MQKVLCTRFHFILTLNPFLSLYFDSKELPGHTGVDNYILVAYLGLVVGI